MGQARTANKEAMADPKFYNYLNEFQTLPRTRRWWPKVIAIFAAFGCIYGAAMGAVISTTVGAGELIGVVAAVMAVLCGVPGARFGSFIGMLNRVRFGRLFVGMFTAMGGAILGGYWDGVDESDNPFAEEKETEARVAWEQGWRKARVDDYDEDD